MCYVKYSSRFGFFIQPISGSFKPIFFFILLVFKIPLAGGRIGAHPAYLCFKDKLPACYTATPAQRNMFNQHGQLPTTCEEGVGLHPQLPVLIGICLVCGVGGDLKREIILTEIFPFARFSNLFFSNPIAIPHSHQRT